MAHSSCHMTTDVSTMFDVVSRTPLFFLISPRFSCHSLFLVITLAFGSLVPSFLSAARHLTDELTDEGRGGLRG
jgi:hypothetical protein